MRKCLEDFHQMTSFPRMLTGKILRIPPYLVGIRENTDRKNSVMFSKYMNKSQYFLEVLVKVIDFLVV